MKKIDPMKVYIIAEAGVNHNGKIENAIKLAKVSKENVEAAIDEIKSDNKLDQISKKTNKLKSKVKEVLKNLD